MRVIICSLAVMLASFSAFALDVPPPEVGDLTSRPGIGDAVLAVPRGAILVNPGLTIAGPPIATVADDTATVADVLIRVGLADAVEARGAIVLVADGARVDMIPSFAMGVQLLRESEFVPNLLGIGTLTLPTYSAADLAGEVRLSAGKGFGDFGVAMNLATLIEGSGVSLSGTLGAGVGLPGGLSPFVEVFADTSLARFAPNIGVDAGTGIQITKSVAVDISAGWTFIGEPDVFVSVGASLLWL